MVTKKQVNGNNKTVGNEHPLSSDMKMEHGGYIKIKGGRANFETNKMEETEIRDIPEACVLDLKVP